MTIYRTADGPLQVRCESTEAKPEGTVKATDNLTKGVYDVPIRIGDELVEIDTGKVFLYTASGWTEF